MTNTVQTLDQPLGGKAFADMAIEIGALRRGRQELIEESARHGEVAVRSPIAKAYGQRGIGVVRHAPDEGRIDQNVCRALDHVAILAAGAPRAKGLTSRTIAGES